MREDNFRYTCGHTGHVVLPTQYDSYPQPISAEVFMEGEGIKLTAWICTACDTSRRMAEIAGSGK